MDRKADPRAASKTLLLVRSTFALVFALSPALLGQSSPPDRSSETITAERIDLKPFPHLAGTDPLVLPKNLLALQYEQIQDYFLAQIARTPALREQLWRPDYSSERSYIESLRSHRDRLKRMLGLLKDRRTEEISRERTGSDESALEEVVIQVEPGFESPVLLFCPRQPVSTAVIVVPPESSSAEEFAGISEGRKPESWLQDLLRRGALVALMRTVERTKDHPLSARLRGKDRRHVLHRLGFVVGRTVVGLEVDQIRAVREYLERRFRPSETWVWGVKQGGMTALYSAAVDEGLAGALVVDYFQRREGAWKEPVDRMLWGQLNEFGDAEVAALIAPRPLIIANSDQGIRSEWVEEAERGRRFYRSLGRETRLLVFEEADLAKAADRVAGLAGWSGPERAPLALPSLGRERIERIANRHFETLYAYLRRLVGSSRQVREARWNLAATPEQNQAQRVNELRRELALLIGEIRDTRVALNPRTRLVKLTHRYAAYEVLMNALPGVEVYGQLLVPRGAREPLPAVICQHGLAGAPEYTTGLSPEQDQVYHRFGSRLAEAGYVVFAPYLTTPVPQDRLINPLVRQAATLGKMRTSIELSKLKSVVDFLQTLPVVDGKRVGYYGLSYGGYCAAWMPPLEPRLSLTIVSGHFNDWEIKISDDRERTSFLLHPDEDFYNWDVLNRFTHLELSAAMWPRPVCIEYGTGDTTTTPEWAERAWDGVHRWARAWGVEERVVRDRFDGGHEIHGAGTFEFLDRWLRPSLAPGRDYAFELEPVRSDLPGIGDPSEDIGPYATAFVDANQKNAIRGDFLVTPELSSFRGLKLRVSRVGAPGNLIVRFGTAEGKSDIGESRLAPQSIHPLYDLAYEARLEPKRLEPGRRCYFEVTTDGGWITENNHYVIYGPRPLGGRARLPRFNLSYELLTDRQNLDSPKEEHRFEFIRSVLAPYRPDPLPEQEGKAVGDEVKVTSEWSAVMREDSDEVVRTAAEDLSEFFREVLAVNLRIVGAALKGPRIELSVRDGVDGVKSREGYRIDVLPGSIRVTGLTSRGVMRGVYWLEDAFRLRRGPALQKGVVVRNERFSPRITMPVLSGAAKYTETSRPLGYTDGMLRRISHDGFNALWVWLNVEEATLNSTIFPEFNDPEAGIRFRRLRDLTERAHRYGIDVLVYLATGYHHHIPDSFYDRRPDLRGYGWGKPLCTSHEVVRRYYAETVKAIFTEAPKTRGLIVIYDSEGFFYCGNRESNRQQCPRCRNHSQLHLSSSLLRTLKDAMREAGGADKEFIAWNYDKDSEWVLDLIPMLPKDIIIQSNFSKGTVVERDGVKSRAGDYNLTSVGPPELFLKIHEAASQNGLRLMAKTEHAVSQEAIFVPYIPAMEQWYRRIARIRDFNVCGWFGNWSHYGWMPSRSARLINWMSFDPAPPMDEMLGLLARRDFSEKVTPGVLRAWHQFSEGIRHFPYSDPVARTPGPLQKGPSHPLFLDPKVESFGRWRSWQNDLEWAKPWGTETTRQYLGQVARHFDGGVAELDSALQLASGADRGELQAEWRVARTVQASLRTIVNLIDWIRVRDEYFAADKAADRLRLLPRLRAVALAEYHNADAVLAVLEGDSRLGYASEGGGVVRGGLFSARLVHRKIGVLEDLLIRELPALEADPD